MANVNKGNAFIYGATLDLRLSSPNVWAFKANLTYTHGGSVDSHHPLPSISPLFGHLTLRYIVGKSRHRAHTESQREESGESQFLGSLWRATLSREAWMPIWGLSTESMKPWPPPGDG